MAMRFGSIAVLVLSLTPAAAAGQGFGGPADVVICFSGDPMPTVPIPGRTQPPSAASPGGAEPAGSMPNACPASDERRASDSAGRVTGPLYIVDGVTIPPPGSASNGNPLRNVGPADILTMEVVKGAAALERFGPEARYGAVVVRTISGTAATPRR